MTTETQTETTAYLNKFSYRSYEGNFEPRWKRILQIIYFEVTASWHRSTLGKVLIVLTLFTNFIGVILVSTITAMGPPEAVQDALRQFVADYMNLGDRAILAGTYTGVVDMQMNIGILLILLFGVAGSGLFADDKAGKTIEIYLSRLQKKEYVTGKVGAIIVYINLFVMIPLILIGILFSQALGLNHADQIGFYMGIILYAFLLSLILGLLILTLSSFVEKRSYASMAFFLFYLLLSLIGYGFAEPQVLDQSELFLLISPSFYLILLGYVCMGDFHLALDHWSYQVPKPFLLDDGYGLEYWHIILTTIAIIVVLTSILAFKIRKLTTEEL